MSHLIFFKKILILVFLFILFDFLISLFLLNGLNKYYGFSKNPEVLINGSSMTISGFNRKAIGEKTNMQISTYAQEGVSVIDRHAMINHFFQMYPKGLKTVVYEVNPVLFSNIKTSENAYTIFYPYMDNDAIDKYIEVNANIKDYYLHKFIRSLRFDSRLIRLIMMGYLEKYDNLKTNTLDTTAIVSMSLEKGKAKVIMEKSSLEVFKNTMELIRSHDVGILLVMMPMHYSKLQTFTNEDYHVLCNFLEDYSSAGDDIKFLDLNQDTMIFDSRNFSDPLHFNVYGQRHITNVVGSYLTGE